MGSIGGKVLAVSDRGPVNIAPTASFTFDCTDLSCDFTDTSTDDNGVTSWDWNFDGDGSSTSQNPTHTFSAAGTYSVTLTVGDGEFTDSVSNDVTVTEPVVNDPPVASFTFDCTDLSCNFTDTSTDDNGVTSWDWNFDGDGTSTSQNPTHKFSAAGTYSVTLIVGDGEFTDSASNDVTVTSGAITVDLVGTATVSRNKWDATVEDLEGNQLNGTWSESGTASCSGNICTLSGLHVRKVLSVTFTETITGNGISIVVNQSD